MTQLELPLCSVFRVKIQVITEVDVPAADAKAAKRFVEEHFFPKLPRPKIMGVYRVDMLPAKEENEDEDEAEITPNGRPPGGRPNPGGTQGGGSIKPIPKPADLIAKAS